MIMVVFGMDLIVVQIPTLLNTLPPGLYNLGGSRPKWLLCNNIPVINPDSLSTEFVANDVLMEII